MSPQSFPSDSNRYSKKLWQYLLALEAITKALKDLKIQGIADDEPDFHRVLKQVLPGLKQAFNSKIAFYADGEGIVHFTEPQDSRLVGKSFLSSK